MNELLPWINLLSAIGVLAAAGAAWKSALSSSRSARAAIVGQMLSEYGSEEMHKDLRVVHEYHDQFKGAFSENTLSVRKVPENVKDSRRKIY